MKVYEGIIAKDVNRIANYLDAFMLQNGIDPKNIDSLVLTSGISMVGSIQKLPQKRFPHVNLNPGDNFKSAAKGLAYSVYIF
ncbi:molecular chaperone DnaK (HSP70) [Mucilaginibacter sp. UYNi724]